jgi:hypothetical protein
MVVKLRFLCTYYTVDRVNVRGLFIIRKGGDTKLKTNNHDYRASLVDTPRQNVVKPADANSYNMPYWNPGFSPVISWMARSNNCASKSRPVGTSHITLPSGSEAQEHHLNPQTPPAQALKHPKSGFDDSFVERSTREILPTSVLTGMSEKKRLARVLYPSNMGVHA